MRQVFLVFIFCFSVMLSPAFAADDVAPEITAAFEDGKTAYDAGDYAKAYEIWLPLAKSGHPRSQNALAVLYGTKEFLQFNLAKKNEWLIKSGNANYSPAQYNLWLFHGHPKNNAYDMDQAIFWLYVSFFSGFDKAVKTVDKIEAHEYQSHDAISIDLVKEEIESIKNEALEWLSMNHPKSLK